MAIVNLMNQFFRVRTLTTEVAKIEDDVDVLLVIHPRELGDKTLYAIDQFVLRGGRAMVFVDPFAELGGAGQPQRMPRQTLSRFDRLFDAWGIEFDPEKFAADRRNAMRVSIPAAQGGGRRDLIVDYLSWLQLGSQNLSQDDVVTSQIGRIALASAGFLTHKDGAATEFKPLIVTSLESMRMPAKEIRITPNPIGLIEKFVSEDKKLVLAARVQGKVGSAFADGPPADDKKAAEDAAKKDGAGAAAEKEDAEPAAEHLTASAGSIHVVVVADTDILADQMWFQEQDFFGQRVMVPTANNADFVINVVDNLVGSNALVDLRGRGLSVRPFERINSLQREAEMRYRKTEQELREKLDDTQRKLGELETDKSGEGTVILTERQRATLDGFRNEMVSVPPATEGGPTRAAEGYRGAEHAAQDPQHLGGARGDQRYSLDHGHHPPPAPSPARRPRHDGPGKGASTAMNPKAFIGLAAVTVVAAAAAIASVVDRYGTVQSSSSQESVFPGFVDKINEVAEVSVTFGDGELVVKRRGEGWVLASRSDYPVSAEKVNKVVVQLSQLLLYEPKTKMPERYPRIDVEDIATEKSESKLLRLRDAAGGSLAEAIIGKDQYFMAGPSRRGVYLRKPGEAQAWLASGRLEITKNARDFVVRDIMDVHSKRVRSVETIAPDGSKLVSARAQPTEADYKVEDLPADAKLKPSAPGTLRDMGSALSVIDLNERFAGLGDGFLGRRRVQGRGANLRRPGGRNHADREGRRGVLGAIQGFRRPDGSPRGQRRRP